MHTEPTRHQHCCCRCRLACALQSLRCDHCDNKITHRQHYYINRHVTFVSVDKSPYIPIYCALLCSSTTNNVSCSARRAIVFDVPVSMMTSTGQLRSARRSPVERSTRTIITSHCLCSTSAQAHKKHTHTHRAKNTITLHSHSLTCAVPAAGPFSANVRTHTTCCNHTKRQQCRQQATTLVARSSMMIAVASKIVCVSGRPGRNSGSVRLTQRKRAGQCVLVCVSVCVCVSQHQ